jgi:penicillin-binding protein 2
VSYAPANDPQVSLAIVVENAGHGGSVCAPIARDFYLEFFKSVPEESLITRAPRPGPEQGQSD